MTRVIVAALLGFLLGSLLVAGAQVVAPAPCGASLACLSIRVKDLQDYRDFLEDQVALVKAVNADLTRQVQTCRPAPAPAPDLLP